MAGMRPPKHDGGGFMGTYQISSPGPINNITVFKKADDARIRELLAICNWLAAPFGTEEYLYRKYGLPGVDYTFSGGQPSQTQAGVTQINGLGVRYIVDAPDTLFVPGNPAATQTLYDFQKQVLPTSVPNASATLYSDTWARKQGQLGTIINNAQNDILSGRQPVSSWDGALKQWRQTGGDQVRAEFEAAAKQAGARGSSGRWNRCLRHRNPRRSAEQPAPAQRRRHRTVGLRAASTVLAVLFIGRHYSRYSIASPGPIC